MVLDCLKCKSISEFIFATDEVMIFLKTYREFIQNPCVSDAKYLSTYRLKSIKDYFRTSIRMTA